MLTVIANGAICRRPIRNRGACQCMLLAAVDHENDVLFARRSEAMQEGRKRQRCPRERGDGCVKIGLSIVQRINFFHVSLLWHCSRTRI